LLDHPTQVRPLFSTEVYRDAAFLNANAGGADEIVSSAWGPGTPLFSLACPAARSKYRDDLWQELAILTPTTAPSSLRSLFGDRRVLLVSVHDVAHAGLPSQLYANTQQLLSAYTSAFPGRHPETLLTTGAYDITYLGPGSFERGERNC
jgi:hypothetical protein